MLNTIYKDRGAPLGKLILITGGERSGKSSLACQLAAMFSDSPAFIATAEPGDEEMRRRIDEHRRRRPSSWMTIEEPLLIHGAVENCGREVVIIDCLTLWLSNCLQNVECGGNPELYIFAEIRFLLELVRRKDIVAIIVTNEVGMGVIPSNPLAREFTHLQGLVNQTVAGSSDVVIAMISGQPVVLKGEKCGSKLPGFSFIPFRIGTTSYIYPADIETNLRRLAHQIDDMELVIFESEQISAYPSPEEVLRLCSYSARADLSCTVHFPLKCSIAHPDEKLRRESVEEVIKLIHRMEPLMPFAYILHVSIEEIPTEGRKLKLADEAMLKDWQSRAIESLKRIMECGVEPSEICLESLDYPLEYLNPIFETTGVSLCLDTGHLMAYRQDMRDVLIKYFDFVRVIHLHWHDGSFDHAAIPDPMPPQIRGFLQLLMRKNFQGVITLEVFSEKDFEQSMKVMSDFVVRRCGSAEV